MKSGVILLVVTIAGSAMVAQDNKSEADCRARLQRLGAGVRGYKMIHDGKSPEKLSDLYYEGLVDRVSDFTCPASGTTIAAPTEIDSKTDYTLDPAPDTAGTLVRERASRHQANQLLAVFADGTVKGVAAAAAGATSATQATPATAGAPPGPPTVRADTPPVVTPATPPDVPPVKPPVPPPSPPAAVTPPPATVPPPPAPAPRTIAPYVHPRRGFGLTPPAGWTIDDTGDRIDLQLTSERGDDVFEVSTVASALIAPAAFAAQWESANVGSGKPYKVRMRQDQLLVDGRRAHAAVYYGETTIGKAVFVSTDESVFVVTAVFKRSNFAAREAVFDRMVRSFVLPRR